MLFRVIWHECRVKKKLGARWLAYFVALVLFYVFLRVSKQ